MKKTTIITLATLIIVLLGGIYFYSRSKSTPADSGDNSAPELPLNAIPLSERPFVTLAPDASGRSLNITLSGAPTEGELEYEMIYNASGKQEGALGSIFLAKETQPITKAILLGSKSGGGKVTYHEGVTGGSMTLQYGNTRLKESWNYLRFDPQDPSFSSTDGKLGVTLAKTGLSKDAIILTMKTFGYPKAGLPADPEKVVAGPYAYFTQTPVKGPATIVIKLPAGEHQDPTLYQWSGTTWTNLVSKLEGDALTASSTNNVFLVTVQ